MIIFQADIVSTLVKDTSILTAIADAPLIFDGAMGTMIYQRGVFLNTCYDELNLTRPSIIEDIHREYIDAGADVIETNSFGANRIGLTPFGLADKVSDINRSAVEIARSAAGSEAYVAASVGPCTGQLSGSNRPGHSEIIDALTEQITALAEAKPDLLILETFPDPALLIEAAALARTTDIPVLASFTIASGGPNENIEAEITSRLNSDKNIDIIGFNCSLGPAEMFHPAKQILKAASKPVLIMPNAGGPREVGGRMLYLNSPEYFTEFAKRYIELGARAVGGCCGTTPAHIRMASRAIKAVSGPAKHIVVISPSSSPDHGEKPKAAPFAEKSSFSKALAAGQKVTSVEILPPQSKAGLDKFISRCLECENAGVDAINLPDGPRASARMSVISTAVLIKQKLHIEPIPHYCCRDRNLIGMQSDLLGASALGLNTWLFITGDPPKLGNYPDATGVFDLDAIGIAQLASNLNHGLDAAGQNIGAKTDMVIGVGANPVAVEIHREIERYFRKIDAGAEYAITQPVFDIDTLLHFIDEVSKYNTTIPVIAGIYPLLSLRNAEFMNEHVPGVVVPDRILARMAECKTREDAIKTGIDIARETLDDISDAVQGFQASAPMGRTDIALSVLGIHV